VGKLPFGKVPAGVSVGLRLEDLADRTVRSASKAQHPIEIQTAQGEAPVPQDAQGVQGELAGTVLARLDFCTVDQETVGPEGGALETEGHAWEEGNKGVQSKPETQRLRERWWLWDRQGKRPGP
jgi:hypothetical protein